ncbi:MAG: hypothetical protein GQ532_18320 [Methylomarinum sp.]|nr:hypothetical protein [Methylomarinum sp.]
MSQNIVCPKCQYIRKEGDDPSIPFTTCPDCGVIYSKWASYNANKVKANNPELFSVPEPTIASKFKFNLSIIRAVVNGMAKHPWRINGVLFSLLIIFNISTAPSFTWNNALVQCQMAIKNYSRDPDTAEVPFVSNIGAGDWYRFSWGRSTSFIRMRNGLGLEVPVTADCEVDGATKRITSLTINEKSIY